MTPISPHHHRLALARLDTLTKPRGSLGRLEEVAAQIAAIQAEEPAPLKKAIYLFAADHGITAERVSAYPGEVTHQMVLNFLAGGAAINQLARLQNIPFTILDAGILTDLPQAPHLLLRKVARGTRNFRREPAMTRPQLLQALALGAEAADLAAAAGHNLLAVGEMGIGNTTSAAALTAALTRSPAARVTGPGTGLPFAAQTHKAQIIEQSLALHFPHGTTDPLEMLEKLGGFEIAAMTGFFLRAPQHRAILVLDGFIATAAAALAAALEPAAQGYMIAAHQSPEPGHRILLDHLQLKPLLTLDMRLGEATGAALALPLIESAHALFHGMATFQSAAVSRAL